MLSSHSYEIDENMFYNETMKVNGQVFNIPKMQMLKHSQNKFQLIKLNRITQFNSTSIVTDGSEIEYEYPDRNDVLVFRIFCNMTITENNTGNNSIVCGPCIFDRIQLLHDGVVVSEHEFYESFVKNCANKDSSTAEQYLLTDAGVTYNDVKSVYTIAQNTTKSLMFFVPTILDNVPFYAKKLKSGLHIRVRMRQGISVTANANLWIGLIDLYAECISISHKLQNHLLSAPKIDYKLNRLFHKKYTLSSGITSGLEYEVLLNSYNYQTNFMIVFLQASNQNLTNLLTTLQLSKIKITDKNSENLINSLYYDEKLVKNITQKFFRETDFFNQPGLYFYLISFSNNPSKALYENEFWGWIMLDDSKLVFTSAVTNNWTIDVHVLFSIPSTVSVSNEKINYLFKN